MEGRGQVIKFPNAATPSERASIRSRQEGIESGNVSEIYSSLDLAKAVGIRRTIEEERRSEIAPYRFSAEKIAKARADIEDRFTYSGAIKEVNDSIEDMVRLNPLYYLALLDFIESHASSNQDDE